MISFISFCFCSGFLRAQIIIANNAQQYIQDFGTSPIFFWNNNITFPGWYKSAGNFVGEVQITNAIPTNAGGFYAYTCNTQNDRKIGFRPANSSGGPCNDQSCGHAYGVRFFNNTGAPITNVLLSYEAFQFSEVQDGGNQNTIFVDYKIGNNLNSVATGVSGWTNVPALNFAGPIVNGNCGTDQLAGLGCSYSSFKTACVSLNLPPGQEVMIRFLDNNSPCNDPHFGIDNVEATFYNACPNPILNPVQNANVCEYFVFPAIQGQNLSGNEAYYLGVQGNGPQYLPGDTLFLTGTTTIYIYDEYAMGSCTSSACSAQTSFQVQIEPAIVPSFSNLVAEICLGDALSPLPITSNNGISGNWSPALNTNNVGTTEYVFVPNGAVCAANFSYFLEIHPLPTPAINGSNDYCFETSALLSSSNVFSQYLWSNGNTNAQSSFTMADNPITLEVVDQNGCSNVSNQFFVSELPKIEHIQNIDICDGDSIFIHGNWVKQAGNYESVFNTAVCDSLDIVNLTINPIPEFNFTTSSLSNCSSSDGEILLSGLSANTNYTLTLNGVQSQINTDANGTFLIDNLTNNQYSFSLTSSSACNYQASTSISIENGVQIDEIITLNETCHNFLDGKAEAIVSGGQAPFSFVWSNGVTTATNDLSNLAPGNYSITVYDANNCQDNISFTILAADEILISGIVSESYCALDNGSIDLVVSGGIQPYEFVWNPQLQGDLNLDDLQPGNYEVLVTDANACKAQQVFVVGQFGELNVQIAPDSILMQTGDIVTAEIISPVDLSGININWFPEEIVDCLDCTSTVVNPDSSTVLYVYLIDEDGCEGIDSIRVWLDVPCVNVQLPTIFSPNNDGLNDELCVLGDCEDVLSFEVFNRWGQSLHKSNVLDGFCWDGTFNNQQVEPGIYVWKITTFSNMTGEKVYSGNVQLIK